MMMMMNRMTYCLEGVGEELSDDAAAGASQAVDQRVRHDLVSSL